MYPTTLINFKNNTGLQVSKMTDNQLQKITWELSLESPDAFRPVKPRNEPSEKIRFLCVAPACAAFNWFLFHAIGEPHRWGGREEWDRTKWSELVNKESVETWVAYLKGTPVGYAELEHRDDGSVQILCFGLLPQFIGQGLGSVLLARTVERAWEMGANRVWLRTCNHDHPHARPNYEARGFQLVEETIGPPNPRLTPILFTGGDTMDTTSST